MGIEASGYRVLDGGAGLLLLLFFEQSFVAVLTF